MSKLETRVEYFSYCFATCFRIITICCFTEYLLLITDRIIVSSGLKSSCEAPAVIEGQEGKIFCTFEDDISKRLPDLEVHHFIDIILNCKGNDKICHTTDGYEIEGEINNKVTIKIPKVNKDKAGHYSCYVAPSEPEEVQSCNLNVTDFEETAYTSSDHSEYINTTSSVDFEETAYTSSDHSEYINTTSSVGQEQSIYGEYLYLIPIVLGSALLMSSLIFILFLSTRFTHMLV